MTAPQGPSPNVSAESGQPTPKAKVFDRAAALRIVDGEEETLREMVELFAEDCPASLRALREAAVQGQREKVAFLAHKLAGTLMSLAAESSRVAARNLERAESADTATALKELEQQLEVLLADLRREGLLR